MKAFIREAVRDLTALFFSAIRFGFSVSGILAIGMALVILFLQTSAGLTSDQALIGVIEITGSTLTAAVSVAVLKLVFLVAGVIYDAARDRVPFWRA